MGAQLDAYASVIEHAATAMALLLPDGTFVAVNDSYAELLGVEPADLAGRCLASVTYSDDVGTSVALAHQLATGERGYGRMTKRYVRPDGAVVWADVSVSAHCDDDGETVALVANALPVHGPTAEQVTLRESEERFRVAFDNAPTGMAIVGLGGELLRVNRSFAAALGRARTDVVGLRIADVLHPDDLPGAVRARGRLLAGEVGSIRAERRLLRGDGSALWAQITSSLVRDDQGQPAHFVLHTVDLSAHERRSESAASRLSLIELNVGADDLLVYRLRFDPMRFDHISDSVQTMVGYSPDELYADADAMFDFVHPDDVPRLLTLLANPAEAPRDVVLRWRHRDGHEVVTKSQHAPLYEDGQLVGLEGVHVEVTAQRESERARERSEARFRSLVQNSTDALIVTDLDGRITYANESVERILGWRLPPPDGAVVWDFVHPDDAPAVRRLFPGAASGVQARVRTRDGAWRWMEAIVTDLVDDPAVHGVVINARDIHPQRMAEEALRDAVMTDPLTGLPNRMLLEDRITRSMLRSRKASTLTAVCIVDVDDFAGINTTIGYRDADRVLIEVAGRLVETAADTHTVARLAGDEFVVCADGFVDPREVEHYACSLATAVARIQVARVDVTASVGIAIAGPASTAADVVARAGAALAEAKERDRGSICLYEAALAAPLAVRPSWDRDLRGAAANNELRTLYQPIVDLASRRIVGAEALLRWQHPVDGSIPPDEFIPAAERSGAIGALGAWVLNDACRTLAEWRRRPSLGSLTMSVNLSTRQLGDRAVLEVLDAALRDNRLPPDALTVEVTESAALAHAHVDVLRDIDALGVTVALDDFGTHYSSLSYLQRLPLRQLKIDRSFVSGIGSDRSRRAIVMATAQLARELGLRTVGEGVEHDHEATELQLFGIDCGQGYHFGRPMTSEDFLEHVGRE